MQEQSTHSILLSEQIGWILPGVRFFCLHYLLIQCGNLFISTQHQGWWGTYSKLEIASQGTEFWCSAATLHKFSPWMLLLCVSRNHF